MKFPFRLPRNNETRNRLMGVILGLIVASVVSLCFSDRAADMPVLSSPYDLMKNLEYKVYDARFRIRGPMKKSEVVQDIILLDIDDESYEWKPWPFDRTLYAEVVRALGTEGSRTKGTFFDVFFFDPSVPVLNLDMAKVFEEMLGQLPPLVQQDQALIEEMKGRLYTLAEQLRGPVSPKTLADAKAELSKIVSDPRLQLEMQSLNSIAMFLMQTDTLAGLTPDRDMIFHDAIRDSKNVYLAQIVSKREDTPYDVADVLYNQKIHDVFAKLILMKDRTKTENKLEVKVNYALRNMGIADFDRILKETSGKDNPSGARKAIPFTRKERKAIEAERLKVAGLIEGAVKINYPFGFDIDKNAPVPKEKIFKRYINVVNVETVKPVIGEYVAGVGYVMPELQKYDGTIRAVAPVVVFNGRIYAHIDLILAMKYLGVSNKDVDFHEDKIVLNNARVPEDRKSHTIAIPVYENGTMLVNWAGTFMEPNTFVHRSFRRVYDDAVLYNILKKKESGESLNSIEQSKIAPLSKSDEARIKKNIEFFDGKLTMTGLTAADTHDLNPTPFHPRYPLVGMHANLINTIINKLFIRTVPFWILLAVTIGLSVLIGLTGGSLKQSQGALITFGTAAGYTVFSILLFTIGKLWIPLIPVNIAIVMTYLMVILYRFMTEGQEAKRMKAMFSTYVNPEVVETLIQHPEKLQLGGEKMDLTAMFALCSGPGLEDAETPEELVDRLNEFFTVMTDDIFEYDGMLDKYEGSIIMAVFGAPIHYADNAVKACYAVLGMHKATQELYKKWDAEGKKHIHVSVGLNSGPMIAGNMGSQSRFNYTIMGDSVNLAARLLGANKQYNTRLMISQYTYDKAKDAVIARSIDRIRVKGRDEPVEVFELMGRKDEGMPENMVRCKEHFEAGSKLYLSQKWDEAIAEFRKSLEANPADGPSKIYITRCEEFKINPPGEVWDGVYTMTTK